MAVTPFKYPTRFSKNLEMPKFPRDQGQGSGGRLFKQFLSDTAGYFKCRFGLYIRKTACNTIVLQIFAFLTIVAGLHISYKCVQNIK